MDLIERWQREMHSSDKRRQYTAIRLRSLYESLAIQLFHQYEPTKKFSSRNSRDFLIRLNEWLQSFSNDEDRWVAFRSIEYLFFAGNLEFEELYRCALDHVIVPWLVDRAGIDIFSAEADQKIEAELKACWPCPITDSLRINGFLHVTRLLGKDLRPDWNSLRKLASPEKIEAYKKEKGIKYLVLLEDFVGSGGQLCKILKFAAQVFTDPIIVVPLIVCAAGNRKILEEIASINRSDIAYKPVLVVEDSCLVGSVKSSGEPKLFDDLRQIMKTGYEGMKCEMNGAEFGWEGVGSMVVMYSNCPNNTPPIFHYDGPGWTPLFPRLEREMEVRL